MNVQFKPISSEKNMANGQRNLSPLPLTEDEIELVIREGKSIGIEPGIYVFNDESHRKNANLGTGYNWRKDKIYITKNVFPDEVSFSTHPRDRLSVRAVLAHEYYGHRPFRDEYLRDHRLGEVTTPEWEDECRASINAAINAPNLTDMERSLLLDDAIYRAKEYGHELDPKSESNKELRKLYDSLYGYPSEEKYIVPVVSKIIPKYIAAKEDTFKSAFIDSNPQLSEDEVEKIFASPQITEIVKSEAQKQKYVESVKERLSAVKEDIKADSQNEIERIEKSFEAKESPKEKARHSFGMSR